MIVAHVLRRLVSGTARGMLRRWPTTLLTLGLLVGGVAALAPRGQVPGMPSAVGGEAGRASESDTREMIIENLRQTRPGEQIDLVLKEKAGNRRLMMAVEMHEARSIVADLNRRTDGPMTFELMRSLVQELGGSVNRVVVNNVTETTFHAKVVMNADNRQIEIESRPSDAIALALRSKAPIFAEAGVLDKAGVASAN